jgi:hypothetical protein
MVVETQIDGHLDLVTATLARPYMTDFVVAHVCRRLWRDQQVIAFAARHSRARAIVRPRGQHDHLPILLVLNGVGTQCITTLRRSTCGWTVRAGTSVSVTTRAVCTPTKGPGDGSAERAHRKVVRPRGGSDPSGSDYYLKPRLSRGFFMSAIHRLRNHLVRVVLKTQVPGGH